MTTLSGKIKISDIPINNITLCVHFHGHTLCCIAYDYDDMVLTFLMLTMEYPIMMRAKKAGKTTKAAMLSLGMIASRDREREEEKKM